MSIAAASPISDSTGEQSTLVGLARVEADPREVTRLATSVRDWERLTSLAARHGLIPLLHHHLRSETHLVPVETQTYLRGRFEASARWNLFLTTHLLELVRAFEAAEIRVLAYKGLAVGEAYYGGQLHRPVGDIDFIVDPRKVDAASSLLTRLGYRSEGVPRARELGWVNRHEQVFLRGEVPVELHWRVSPRTFPIGFRFEALWERAAPVSIAGQPVLHFSAEDAVIVLSAHAARHSWERLIWLVDLVQLMEQEPHLDWELVLARSRSLGCERIVVSALLLCERLLLKRAPPVVNGRMRGDLRLAEIAAVAESRSFAAVSEPITPGEREYWGVALRERFRDRIRFACRNRFSLRTEAMHLFPLPVRWWIALVVVLRPYEFEWRGYNLPPRLQFLGYLLRPLRLLVKQARKCLRNLAGLAVVSTMVVCFA